MYYQCIYGIQISLENASQNTSKHNNTFIQIYYHNKNNETNRNYSVDKTRSATRDSIRKTEIMMKPNKKKTYYRHKKTQPYLVYSELNEDWNSHIRFLLQGHEHELEDDSLASTLKKIKELNLSPIYIHHSSKA